MSIPQSVAETPNTPKPLDAIEVLILSLAFEGDAFKSRPFSCPLNLQSILGGIPIIPVRQ